MRPFAGRHRAREASPQSDGSASTWSVYCKHIRIPLFFAQFTPSFLYAIPFPCVQRSQINKNAAFLLDYHGAFRVEIPHNEVQNDRF